MIWIYPCAWVWHCIGFVHMPSGNLVKPLVHSRLFSFVTNLKLHWRVAFPVHSSVFLPRVKIFWCYINWRWILDSFGNNVNYFLWHDALFVQPWIQKGVDKHLSCRVHLAVGDSGFFSFCSESDQKIFMPLLWNGNFNTACPIFVPWQIICIISFVQFMKKFKMHTSSWNCTTCFV